MASLRTLNTAQISYDSAYPTVGFAARAQCSRPEPVARRREAPGRASSIPSWRRATKSGYSFALSGTAGTPASTYQVIATPLAPNQTGVRYFCSFADAVVRYSCGFALDLRRHSVTRYSKFEFGKVPGGGYKPERSRGEILCFFVLWAFAANDCLFSGHPEIH